MTIIHLALAAIGFFASVYMCLVSVYKLYHRQSCPHGIPNGHGCKLCEYDA